MALAVINTTVDYYVPPATHGLHGISDADFEEQYGDKCVDHHPIKLRDMRAGDFSLENNGFELIRYNSRPIDFSDLEAVKNEYFPGLAETIKKHTGASEVHVVLPKIRNTSMEKSGFAKGWNNNNGPIRRSHIDVAPGGIVEGLGPVFGEEYLRSIAGRWKLVNAWKPLDVVERDPLAVIDRIPEEDLITLERAIPGKTMKQERYLIKAGKEDHDWYFAPLQRPDELLLFTQYSDMPGRGPADRVAHASVRLPDTNDKPSRTSIEVRVLVVW